MPGGGWDSRWLGHLKSQTLTLKHDSRLPGKFNLYTYSPCRTHTETQNYVRKCRKMQPCRAFFERVKYDATELSKTIAYSEPQKGVAWIWDD